MYHWNPVLTYLMTGFFHHEKFQPTIAAGLDVNQLFPVVWLQGEYHVSPRLVMRFGDIEYLGSRNQESYASRTS